MDTVSGTMLELKAFDRSSSLVSLAKILFGYWFERGLVLFEDLDGLGVLMLL